MSRAVSVYHGRFGRATLYQLNRPMTTHAHREGHLIFHVRGAPGAVTVCGRRYEFRSGIGMAVNPWEPHDFLPDDLGAGALYLVLYINPGWFLAGDGSAPVLRFGRTEVEITPTVARSIERVVSLLLGGRSLKLFDGSLYELCGSSFEQSWHHVGSDLPRVRADEPIIDFRVRKSMRLLSEQLGGDIELDAVAREAGLSRPHFYKLFRRQTGVTPNLYLNTLLMERAIEVLTQSRKSVTDIGFDLGFSSQSGFTRFFAANVGMPPTDYRRVAQVLRN